MLQLGSLYRLSRLDELYANDHEALSQQEMLWNKIRNQPWKKNDIKNTMGDGRGRGGKQQPPLNTIDKDRGAISFPQQKHLSSSLPLVGLKKKNAAVITFIINNVQILAAGERHRKLPFLIAKIRYFFGQDVGQEFLKDIHGKWYLLWRENMSGDTDIELSFADFMDRWESLPATDPNKFDRTHSSSSLPLVGLKKRAVTFPAILDALEEHPNADR